MPPPSAARHPTYRNVWPSIPARVARRRSSGGLWWPGEPPPPPQHARAPPTGTPTNAQPQDQHSTTIPKEDTQIPRHLPSVPAPRHTPPLTGALYIPRETKHMQKYSHTRTQMTAEANQHSTPTLTPLPQPPNPLPRPLQPSKRTMSCACLEWPPPRRAPRRPPVP